MDNTAQLNPARLLRLPEVLARVPVSKSTIWLWVKKNRFPAPVKIGPRTTAWREDDVQRFINSAAKRIIEEKRTRGQQNKTEEAEFCSAVLAVDLSEKMEEAGLGAAECLAKAVI